MEPPYQILACHKKATTLYYLFCCADHDVLKYLMHFTFCGADEAKTLPYKKQYSYALCLAMVDGGHTVCVCFVCVCMCVCMFVCVWMSKDKLYSVYAVI